MADNPRDLRVRQALAAGRKFAARYRRALKTLADRPSIEAEEQSLALVLEIMDELADYYERSTGHPVPWEWC